MGKTYFVKLSFTIWEFWNGITEIQFDLHIYLGITDSLMNCDTKFVVLDCYTIDCINRIFQNYNNLLHQREKFN
jgi:uncharacterized membrane protein